MRIKLKISSPHLSFKVICCLPLDAHFNTNDIMVFIFNGMKISVFQVEARSIEGVKKQAKGLEMKIIELTQKLDAKVHNL